MNFSFPYSSLPPLLSLSQSSCNFCQALRKLPLQTPFFALSPCEISISIEQSLCRVLTPKLNNFVRGPPRRLVYEYRPLDAQQTAPNFSPGFLATRQTLLLEKELSTCDIKHRLLMTIIPHKLQMTKGT